ncbi:membrane protein [Pontibacillus halophilus JSM 076056 = DSM 19796]|uniref:Membrane protein n=1 Tax=Pontibacillus halophilus JSM 076056 = DSM 19796 TaxID=1385510 RepID=A0A0A5GK79_9BACI|nr:hypothetical protein [Pontibacillus halophilus]KGX91633.1 membrane protein [Pontibacillus halophilus JSM 076056 = DSM 19796]
MELTFVHWVYASITLLIIGTMILRKSIVIPTIIGTFLIGLLYNESLLSGFTSVFLANIVAAKELFNIFLIITLMVALLQSLKDLRADERMILPIQKVMVNGHVAYFVLVVVTYIISLFFWPTPAVPLICALLVPAAIRAGLPAMMAAIAVALAGQGMALSSDYIMQVAPSLSAKGAELDVGVVANKALVLSLVTGVVAILSSYVLYRTTIRSPLSVQNDIEMKALSGENEEKQPVEGKDNEVLSKLFAVLVPLTLFGVMVVMVASKVWEGRLSGFEGGDGAAFIGGVATILMVFATVLKWKTKALDRVSDHITAGFVFAFKAMGPVIPIAGFFFLGSGAFAADILLLDEGGKPPAFLFDLVQSLQGALPESELLSSFSILIVGMLSGLDGSGFSGLPLTGTLAGAMMSSSADASTLAAIGQMGSIWTGGGTIIAWSSLIAVAGFCGVSVVELVRKNFIPVLLGLVAATLVAMYLW